MSYSQQPRPRRRYGTGFILGIAAFVLGYVWTFLLVVLEAHPGWMAEVDAGRMEFYELVGVVFYNAHLVPYNAGRGVFDSGSSLLSDTPPEISVLVFHAVPIAAIVTVAAVAGYYQVKAYSSVDTAAAYGVVVLYGYVVLSFLGGFVFELREGEMVTFVLSPDVGMTVVVMGVIIPAVSGAFGAILGVQVNRRLRG